MRLIDADRLKETISIIQADNDRPPSKWPEYGEMYYYEIFDMVDDAPTIDAVPVVQGSPCDLCRYDPPSSFDGKPCAMCPAEAKIWGNTDGSE